MIPTWNIYHCKGHLIDIYCWEMFFFLLLLEKERTWKRLNSVPRWHRKCVFPVHLRSLCICWPSQKRTHIKKNCTMENEHNGWPKRWKITIPPCLSPSNSNIYSHTSIVKRGRKQAALLSSAKGENLTISHKARPCFGRFTVVFLGTAHRVRTVSRLNPLLCLPLIDSLLLWLFTTTSVWPGAHAEFK